MCMHTYVLYVYMRVYIYIISIYIYIHMHVYIFADHHDGSPRLLRGAREDASTKLD